MIGVDSIEPNTPPLEIENVPPVSSSSASFPSCARLPKSAIFFSISAKLMRSASRRIGTTRPRGRSEEHTSELQSLRHLVCRLLLEKKKTHHPEPDTSDVRRS